MRPSRREPDLQQSIYIGQLIRQPSVRQRRSSAIGDLHGQCPLPPVHHPKPHLRQEAPVERLIGLNDPVPWSVETVDRGLWAHLNRCA